MKNKHIERIPKRLRHIYLKSAGDKSVPKGCYCYTRKADGKWMNCPYWRQHPDKPTQENGYCQKLGVGDWYGRSSVVNLLWDQCKHSDCGK